MRRITLLRFYSLNAMSYRIVVVPHENGFYLCIYNFSTKTSEIYFVPATAVVYLIRSSEFRWYPRKQYATVSRGRSAVVLIIFLIPIFFRITFLFFFTFKISHVFVTDVLISFSFFFFDIIIKPNIHNIIHASRW